MIIDNIIIKKDIVNTVKETIAWGSPNLKLTDLLPLKCLILGETANRIPTKNTGKNIPSMRR